MTTETTTEYVNRYASLLASGKQDEALALLQLLDILVDQLGFLLL